VDFKLPTLYNLMFGKKSFNIRSSEKVLGFISLLKPDNFAKGPNAITVAKVLFYPSALLIPFSPSFHLIGFLFL
jgi:hypothetical protein